ncbi:site-2 protease family protein [Lignipirellula cremea]|uniref:Zinc metalloprotease n=1 Tax=Lignipirellula cremea TaxID=2528010 RepID=A0A518E063_9BACT|nr:site-2 protease family protein [Lignipirellula cremea]QDU97477.1 Putative zinc metalloprotease Rip3 [Lignipirellula cremea]
MNTKWKIGEYAGIGVFVHWSFLIIPALIGFSKLADGGLLAAFWAVLSVLAVFGCVVLHEFGHALTARQFGVGTRDITLYPIGGVATLESMPRRPLHEFLIAVAGPAVNVVIAAALAAGFFLLGSSPGLPSLNLGMHAFLNNLMWTNVVLVVFNMLPAFPMDGGRVLRATLAAVMSYRQATQIAVGVGQAMAVLLAVTGVFFLNNWTLVLIAGFVVLAGRAEARNVQLHDRQAGGWRPGMGTGQRCVGDVMLTQFNVLPAAATLREVSQYYASGQTEFPVIDGNRLVGMMSRADAESAGAQYGDSLLVSNVMERNFPIVAAADSLQHAGQIVQHTRCLGVPVVSVGRLVGVLLVSSLPVAPAGNGPVIDAVSWR